MYFGVSELLVETVFGYEWNPRYAGAFVYGRTKSRKGLHGTAPSARRLPIDQWQVVLRGAHPGYISWEQFEARYRRTAQRMISGAKLENV